MKFNNSGIVESVKIDLSDPSIRGKYSKKLKIDKTLDNYVSIRAKVKHYVYVELFNMLIEMSGKYNSSKHTHITFDDYIESAKEWK